MEDLREWALQRFTPVVMVVSTPEAEALCQEANGLTVVDLLRPFGNLHQLSGTMPPPSMTSPASLCILR